MSNNDLVGERDRLMEIMSQKEIEVTGATGQDVTRWELADALLSAGFGDVKWLREAGLAGAKRGGDIIAELQKRIAELERGETICTKCGLRQQANGFDNDGNPIKYEVHG